MNNKVKVSSFIMALITVLNMSGCAKKVRCDEEIRHSHLYECELDEFTLKKYFNSENISINDKEYTFKRTNYYSINDTKQKNVVSNDLVSIFDNYDYFLYLVNNGYKSEDDKWIFYMVDKNGIVDKSYFDTVNDGLMSGYKYFKLDELIYHNDKKLVRSMS